MNIINSSDEEWDDSWEMLSGNDSALSGLFIINPQDTSSGYPMKNDDMRMASINPEHGFDRNIAYVGFVEE